MPLLRLTRLGSEARRKGREIPPEWVVSDAIQAIDGPAIHALVSGLTVVEAGRVGVGVGGDGGGRPMVLRTHEPTADGEPSLSWMPGARERFSAAADRLTGGEFWLWPSANGVLSDVPSTQSFFRAREGNPCLRLLLDPASLLTPGMLSKAEDHLGRIFAGLGRSAAAILLANIEPLGGVEGVGLAPLTRGVLSPKMIVDLWQASADPLTPVVLLDEDVAGQRAIVGL